MKAVKIIATIIILFGVIQFIPYGKEHKNPKILSEPQWDSPKTKELFDRACKDCHSNYTKYPSYSSIAPISWLIQHDIDEGREHFNISMIGHQKRNKFKDAPEEVEENEMPPLPYLLMHKEARLSDKEKELLIEGLKKTFIKE